MRKEDFIEILENILKNTERYISFDTSTDKNSTTPSSRLNFKTSNQYLFNLINSNDKKTQDEYEFKVVRSHLYPDSFYISEKIPKEITSPEKQVEINDLESFNFINNLINKAKEKNLLTEDEAINYTERAYSKFHKFSLANWIGEKIENVKNSISSKIKNK